jgi:hypothetical protein
MTGAQLPGQPDEPETIKGEIVHDAASAPFGEQWPPGPFGPAVGGTSVGGAFGVFRMLRSSPEVRSLLAAPLRMLTIAVLVPALLAGLLGPAIDGRGGAVVAFTIAGCGVIAAILLGVNRRRLIAGQLGAPPTAGHTAVRPATGSGLRGLVGLIVGALLVMMLAIGFDLLAVLLLLFGAW